MTREDAIICLKWHKDDLSAFDDTVKEAIDMAIAALKAQEPRGTYQCFHCGSYSVVWGADFDFSDYGLEGEGIVHSCHCGNCGADIEYYVRIDDD